MELSQLRALRALRDRGSIAAVGAAFHVTPSAVSQQLAALQRSAGVALTRIEGRRTVLTDAGHALADAAIGVEAAMVEAEEAIASFHDAHAATVSISALQSAAIAFFPDLLAATTAGDPTLELTDRDVEVEEFARLISEIDLVIAHRLPGRDPWPRGIAAVNLLDEPMDLAFRAGHPLRSDTPATAADLAGLEWINVHEVFPLADSVARIGALGGHETTVRHRVNDFGVTVALLAVSDCVALLPRYTGRPYLTSDIALRPLVPDLAVRRRIDVLARPDTLRRTAVAAVLEALQAAATRLIAAG